MNRSIIALLLAAAFAADLSAQGVRPDTLECGRTLMVVAADPYVVYVDGVERGITPLLLWDLAPGTSVIEARYGELSVKLTARVSGAVSELACWRPGLPAIASGFVREAEPVPAAGTGVVTLTVDPRAKAARVTVDGVEAEASEPLSLATGVHVVMASAEGKLPSYYLVAVEPGSAIDLPISFVPDPLLATKAAGAGKVIAFATGVAGTIAGIALASDGVAVPLSGGSYEDYKTIKYSGYGSIGAGLIVAGISGMLVFRQ